MLKKQNNLLKIFLKISNKTSVISVAVMFFILNVNNSFSVVSSQQCDKELEKYCNNSEYNDTSERLKCVERKKNFFTRECVARILGLDYDTYEKKTKNNTIQDDTNIDADSLISQSEKILSNPESITDEDILNENNTENQKIAILTENLLRVNCLSDMSRLCKMKTRKGNVIFKEPVNDCMNKMIKHESRLTLNCHNTLSNIINEKNEQYTFYNVNGITVTKRKNLRHAKMKKEQQNLSKE